MISSKDGRNGRRPDAGADDPQTDRVLVEQDGRTHGQQGIRAPGNQDHRTGGRPPGEAPVERARPGASDPPPAEAELLAAGWKRCFVADEPRLSEALETYRDLGYEVTTLPYAPEEGACSECVTQGPNPLTVIYIRKREGD